MLGRELALPRAETPRYDILGSFYFNGASTSNYIYFDSPASVSDNHKDRGVISFIFRRSRISQPTQEHLISCYETSGYYDYFRIQSDNTVSIGGSQSSSYTYDLDVVGFTALQNTWYHVVISLDNKNTLAYADRFRIWINGTEYAHNSYDNINNDIHFQWFKGTPHNCGRWAKDGTYMFNGYMTEIFHRPGYSIQNGNAQIGDFGFFLNSGKWWPRDLSLGRVASGSVNWGDSWTDRVILYQPKPTGYLPAYTGSGGYRYFDNDYPWNVSGIQPFVSNTSEDVITAINSPTFGGTGL